MAAVKINCNHSVAVTLSARGAEVLNQRDRMFDARFPTVRRGEPRKQYVAGERYEAQLWCLMNDFGHTMTVGQEPPFSPLEIEFTTREP